MAKVEQKKPDGWWKRTWRKWKPRGLRYRFWMRADGQPSLLIVCFIFPILLSTGITLFSYHSQWIESRTGIELKRASVLFGSGSEPTLSWPIVWIFGLFIALYGLWLATERNVINAEGYRTNAEGQRMGHYAQAREQLGHGQPLVRNAGLLVLGRLAKETGSKEERQQIIQLATAFVREKAPHPKKRGNDYEKAAPRSERVDIESAVRILADIAKPEDRNGGLADLSHTDLRMLNLTSQHLEGFNFLDSFIDTLNRAYLSGADLSYSYLFGAFLIRADLSGADLSEADLSEARLLRATLSGADLSGAVLSGTRFFRADLSGANLAGVKNLEQNQIDTIIYEKSRRPINVPRGLKLKKGDRVEEEQDGKIFLVLSSEKREKKPAG